MHNYFRTFLSAAPLLCAFAFSAQAASITYTFSGVGSGTLNGAAFTDQNFTATFTGDTGDIDATNPPFYVLRDVSGVFMEGANTVDFTATVESNSSLANIDFYDSAFTNGLGFQDNSLTGYQLSTSIGPITAAAGNLTPTLGSSSFTTSGGDLQFTGETSLTFSAVTGAPEPGTFILLAAGLVLLVFCTRRLRQV